jgi:hypothetical protein
LRQPKPAALAAPCPLFFVHVEKNKIMLGVCESQLIERYNQHFITSFQLSELAFSRFFASSTPKHFYLG